MTSTVVLLVLLVLNLIPRGSRRKPELLVLLVLNGFPGKTLVAPLRRKTLSLACFELTTLTGNSDTYPRCLLLVLLVLNEG